MTELVQLSEKDTHCLLQMDDGKANALSPAMFEALNTALDKARDAGRVLVLAGRPGRFSAGFDLKVMGSDRDSTLSLLRAGAEFAGRLMDFPTPVIAAVSGHALAMGAILCLAVDYRVGVRGEYKIGLNEVAIGMTMPWFGVELAHARLAPNHIQRAVGLATIYEPEGAVAAGFLDEAVEDNALLPRVEALAAAFAALDPTAHQQTKARQRARFRERYQVALERDFAQGEALGG